MKLVVIESPGKRETLQKYLGNSYVVVSSKGHVRDLPIKSLGVDMANNFEPKYEILSDKVSIIEDMRKKSVKADEILLATDPDREGEAIAWHIAECLGLETDKQCRIVFNEISKSAVEEALKHPRKIDEKLVDAQQARRILDRIVGYKLSPIICKKIKPRLSAGRVQSVALKLVVDKEKEIQEFKPEEYWVVNAELTKQEQNQAFKALLTTYKNKKTKLGKKEDVDNILENLNNATYSVESLKKSKTKSHAPAPFTTSTMQQDALNKLNMSLKRTTMAAQQLYEGLDIPGEGKVALITYIRTDSVRVSEDAVKMARQHIETKFGKNYIPAKPNVYSVKKNAQDAHEAIRPISLSVNPEVLKNSSFNDAYRLYKLIYERFIASQMNETEYDNVVAVIKAADCKFKAVGKTMTFAGWTNAYKAYENIDNDEKENNSKLPILEENEILNLLNLKTEQKFTKPPTRYTEASLVKAMEEKEIGRPATYAPTITILSTRSYTTKEGKYLLPTELGTTITGFLDKYFKSIINVQFTAFMESRLDDIVENGEDWHSVLNSFWNSFKDLLNNANFSAYAMPKKEPEITDHVCSKCGKFMVIREGRYGKFLGCSDYPNCKNIEQLERKQKEIGTCPTCKKPLVEKRTKKGKIFYGCSGYPDCNFMSWDIPTGENCPDCNAFMVKKNDKEICSNKSCKYVKS